MEEKINNKLQEYGFTIEDLSKDELEQLRQEIEQEEKGMIILDGVLSHKDRY